MPPRPLLQLALQLVPRQDLRYSRYRLRLNWLIHPLSGSLDSESFILSVSSAYSEVVHWRKNTFTVPYGKVGKKFVYELSTLYRAYAEGSALECIALKAVTVMSVLLQRPHHKIKAKRSLLLS